MQLVQSSPQQSGKWPLARCCSRLHTLVFKAKSLQHCCCKCHWTVYNLEIKPWNIYFDIQCPFSPKKKPRPLSFTFYYPQVQTFTCVCLSSCIQCHQESKSGKRKKKKLRNLCHTESGKSHSIFSTHIDNDVPIHQFCDWLNSFQGDLQFVAFTLNHRLKSMTQDISSGQNMQKDLEMVCGHIQL